MSLTNIGNQKTPARPVEITFDAETGLPSANQEVVLIGHGAAGAASGAEDNYEVFEINNSGDLAAASGEANTKCGAGSELAKMVVAAVRANSGKSTFPQLKCIKLAVADAGFGASDAAITALEAVKAEYAVSPYDFASESALRIKLTDAAKLMSGAQRVDNNQFGTFAVGFARVEDPSTLPKFDTQFGIGVWLPDTDVAPEYSVAEMAAAAAAVMAGNLVPFNPLDSVTLVGVPAPESKADWPTVGGGLESESCLNQGWTPLYVKPNSEVAFVRTVTGRLSPDGSGTPLVTAYYDVQDFNVLYLFRKTVWTRFSQPDFKQRKASNDTAKLIKSEVIRLAAAFEDQNMFQAVSELAKQVQVERNISDRSRFDVRIPVNVIPGLHEIATNIVAGTQFDLITI